ncbi:acyltransferase family protein [Enterovibrio calviensis]|uniref:acyltransferase family protein n=1 Tax=Enterovibrio calviensis TaxID=91359 RepID=UPI003734C8B8
MVNPKLSYRPEIDGLRAVAVISVILYHAKIVLFGSDFFEGGYLGVDIFFVISGYLISRIILSELEERNRLNVWKFYERRARRILPVLFLVMLVSLPVAWYKFPPSVLVEYSKSVISSLFFSSNIFFYITTTEYGANSALLKPFLHTWSLGVEEQFYILFPIVALISYFNFRNYFPHLVVVLSLCSLIFSHFIQASNPDFNFYILFSRFWELAIGSILALMELNGRKPSESHQSKFFSILGFVLIVFSIGSFDNNTPHPSFQTLIPIFGVCLMILNSSSKDHIGRFLGSKPLVFIGLISYSLYMWHFPIFSFFRYGSTGIGYLDKIFLIFLTFFLSVLTFYMVEKPLRSERFVSNKCFLLMMTIIFTFLLSSMSLIILNNGYPSRLPPILSKNDLSEKTWELYNQGGVICYDRADDFCNEVSSKENPTVIMLGDSHLSTLSIPLLNKLDGDFNYIEANYRGCPFGLNIHRYKRNSTKPEEHCSAAFQEIRYSSIPNKPTIVVVGGRMPLYISGHYFNNQEGGVEGDFYRRYEGVDGKSLEQKLEKTYYALLDKGHKLIFVYPIPPVGWNVPNRLFDLVGSVDLEEANRLVHEQPITTGLSRYIEHTRSSFALYDSIKHPNVYRVYPHEIFCDKKISGRCETHNSIDTFYADDDHPSTEGARLIVQPLYEAIVKASKSISLLGN